MNTRTVTPDAKKPVSPELACTCLDALKHDPIAFAAACPIHSACKCLDTLKTNPFCPVHGNRLEKRKA